MSDEPTKNRLTPVQRRMVESSVKIATEEERNRLLISTRFYVRLACLIATLGRLFEYGSAIKGRFPYLLKRAASPTLKVKGSLNLGCRLELKRGLSFIT